MQNIVIKKQIFDLRLSSTRNSWQIKNKLSWINQNKISPLLANICERMDTLEITFHIEKIEVELGVVQLANLQQILLAKIEQIFTKVLNEKIKNLKLAKTVENANSQNVFKLNEAENALRYLYYFCTTGMCPWWVQSKQLDLTKCVRFLTQKAPKELKSSLLKLLPQERYIQRLIWQLPESVLLKLTELWSPKIFSFLKHWQTSINKSFYDNKAFQYLMKMQLKSLYWRAILSNLLTQNPVEISVEEFFRRCLLAIAAECQQDYHYLLLKLSPFQQAKTSSINTWHVLLKQLRQPLEVGKLDNQLTPLTKQLLIQLRNFSRLNVPMILKQHVSNLIEQLTINQDKYSKLNNEILFGNLTKVHSQLNNWMRDLSLINDKPITYTNISIKTLIAKLINRLNFISNKQEFVAKDMETMLYINNDILAKDTWPDIQEDIYINNAGLILLWVFLKQFFINVKLLEQDKFINKAAARRAALLLQYIIDPLPAWSEAELVLNKILCGLDVLEPIESELDITEHEQAECQQLLLAVRTHWPTMGKVSMHYLIEYFLQRKGVIRNRTDHWLLQVERSAHDALAGDRTWPIGIIQLPWLDKLITVEW